MEVNIDNQSQIAIVYWKLTFVIYTLRTYTSKKDGLINGTYCQPCLSH
jgi:hypothetical protein